MTPEHDQRRTLGWFPVPSERVVRVVGGAVIVAFLACVLLIGGRVYVQGSNINDLNREVGELRGTNVAQDKALQEANDRLEDAGQPPVDVPETVETDEAEAQEAEVQDPEVQDPETQDPEVQQPERDDPEIQDSENQDPEGQDGEVDDPDPDDPDPDDPENQDPEIDDPDPNSGLDFAVRDECNPASSEYVTNVGVAVERSAGVVTYVLTCATAGLPAALLRLF